MKPDGKVGTRNRYLPATLDRWVRVMRERPLAPRLVRRAS